ncbi:MAG: hypothetical protein QM532_00085 [Cyanobium sp. MAG06]|nr:hypothetical protein [Cyanobium sp. MAG06]
MKREIQFYLYSLIKTLENNSKNRVSFIITIIGMIINNIFFIVI